MSTLTSSRRGNGTLHTHEGTTVYYHNGSISFTSCFLPLGSSLGVTPLHVGTARGTVVRTSAAGVYVVCSLEYKTLYCQANESGVSISTNWTLSRTGKSVYKRPYLNYSPRYSTTVRRIFSHIFYMRFSSKLEELIRNTWKTAFYTDDCSLLKNQSQLWIGVA